VGYLLYPVQEVGGRLLLGSGVNAALFFREITHLIVKYKLLRKKTISNG
jgi:hypothetical protein